jgi:hypothetical protein
MTAREPAGVHFIEMEPLDPPPGQPGLLFLTFAFSAQISETPMQKRTPFSRASTQAMTGIPM